MGKVVTVIVVVLIVIVGGAAIVMSRNRVNSTSTSSNSSDMSTMDMKSTKASSSGPSQSTNNVSIANFAFSPAAITVKKGTTVTWTNNDSTTHTVTETDKQDGPNSGSLEPGKTYSFTFKSTGTFKYNCSIHPNMTGTVTVTE